MSLNTSENHKQNHENRKKRAAIKYANKGLAVLPLHSVDRNGHCTCGTPNCANAGKHPLTPNGVKDASTSLKTVKRWWRQHPEANIGLATGRPSGLIVLDVDPRNGGDKAIRELEAELGPLPKAPKVRTGSGGYHLYLAAPADLTDRKLSKNLCQGVDFQGDGRYVVVPPSDHPSGNRYCHKRGRRFHEQTAPELPRQYWDLVTKFEKRAQAQKLPEGQRNDGLTRTAGSLVRRGYTGDALRKKLHKENTRQCTPPLEHEEVARIAESIERRDRLSDSNDEQVSTQLARTLLADDFEDGDHLIYAPDSQFWQYKSGVWTRLDKNLLEKLIYQLIKRELGTGTKRLQSLINETLYVLRLEVTRDDDPLHFNQDPPDILNVRNGEIHLDNKARPTFKRHNHRNYLRHQLNVRFDPDARCPKYDAALRAIFSDAKEPEKLVRLWHQIIGYLIQPRRDIPLILMFSGKGDNGKTTLTTLIKNVLGEDMIYAGYVTDLHRPFIKAALSDKLLFLDDDVKANAKLPDGMLKQISEAKTMTADQKYRDPFTFTVRTVPLLLCNDAPSVSDISYGLRRRIMVIPFNHEFTQREKNNSPFPQIFQEELPGVLNRALKGYRQVRKQGGFDQPRDVRKGTADWLRLASPVVAFVEDRCRKEPSAKCSLANLYDAYLRWCREEGLTYPMQRTSLKKKLEQLGYASKKRNTGQMVFGLELKD